MEKLFSYGQTEMQYLAEKDENLGKVIQSLGKLDIKVNTDVFYMLVYSVAGQQINSRAQLSVINKIQKAVGVVTPYSILKCGKETLRQSGLSERKADCIIDAARLFIDNKNIESFLDDEELISTFTRIKGIGRWTAEMLLIFSYERKNILSYGDFGIRKGLGMLLGKSITKQEFNNFYLLYSPYCSVASFYLWKLANGQASINFKGASNIDKNGV